MDKMDNRNCRDFYDFNKNESEDDDESKNDFIGEGGFAIVYKAVKKDTK